MKNRISWLLIGLQGFLSHPVFAQAANEATVEKASNDNLLWLAGLTMLIAIGFGVWQLQKVKKAKRENEHTTLTNVHEPGPRRR